MNSPKEHKGAGALERIKDFASNVGDALHIPSMPSRNQLLAVGAATVTAFGASEISQNSQAEAGSPLSTETAEVSSYSVQSSALALKGFKKCRRGKPAFQTRIVGPTPIKKSSNRDKNLYESEVPSIETPVKYQLQAKSCKKRRGVTFKMSSRRDEVTKRFNMKAGKVRNVYYNLAFDAPDSDVTNPYRRGARKVSIALSQKNKPLGGAMINYLYSDSQLGIGPTASVSEPTPPVTVETGDPTGPTGSTL